MWRCVVGDWSRARFYRVTFGPWPSAYKHIQMSTFLTETHTLKEEVLQPSSLHLFLEFSAPPSCSFFLVGYHGSLQSPDRLKNLSETLHWFWVHWHPIDTKPLCNSVYFKKRLDFIFQTSSSQVCSTVCTLSAFLLLFQCKKVVCSFGVQLTEITPAAGGWRATLFCDSHMFCCKCKARCDGSAH